MPDLSPDKWYGELPDIRFNRPGLLNAIRSGVFSPQLAEGMFARTDWTPQLSVALSGQRKILLSWTFDLNYANFQVFWKSSSPSGQEYVLLGTTNAFSYTTPDLEPSKTYFFYIKANVDHYYYFSNVVELFVSCGKGVVLSVSPPSRPAAQILHGDGYACTATSGARDIYKCVGGVGDYISLNQAARNWYGITVAKSGNVYASVNADGIYKQTNGLGNFVFLQSMYYAGAMTSDPSGNIYCIEQENGGPIWKSGNGGAFAAIDGTGGISWSGIAAAPNGDIYASSSSPSSGGDIYKQSGGTGAFNALGQVYRHWHRMTAAPNGDIYVAVDTAGGVGHSGIYMQSFGVGDFVKIFDVIAEWYAMSASPNRHVYCAVFGGDIYIQNRGRGPFIALNQTVRSWRGLAIKQY